MNKTRFCKIRNLFEVILLMCLSLQIRGAQAQTARFTIHLEKVPMEQVVHEIEAQSRYLFLFNKDIDSRRIIVSVHAENQTITQILPALFKDTGLDYTIEGMSVLVTKKSEKPEKPVTVSGRVTDLKGLPIVGASVIVQGTTLGVSTDTNGRFSLEVPAPASSRVLEISYLGYETARVAVGSRTRFDVTLREAASEIEQVVVTALGIKRQEKALSYNVQQVAPSDITMVKDANFMNSLAGKVAGVTINTSSSGVGGASKVVMRGTKSILQSSNALYVIDGIPMNNVGGGGGTEFDSRGATEAIADLNPEDIESISVLTGASAAALYGSSAANGAIMITTKKGQAGQFRVTYSSQTEFLAPFVMPEFQNRYGTGSYGSVSGSPVYSWGPKLTDAARTGYTPDDFFETGHVYTNAVTLSGGSEKNQTYFSAAAVNSDGIIPNNFYDRYNFTFRNSTQFLNDRLHLDVSASYIVQKDRNMINQGVYSNPVVSAYLFPRGDDFDAVRIFERWDPARKISVQYWPQGEGGDLRMQNPYWIAYRNPRDTDKKRYMASATLSYDILPWLNVSGRARIDNTNSVYTQKLYASSNTTITEGSSQGHYTEITNADEQIYADVIANVNKTFGEEWSLVANVGASINDVRSRELSYRGPIRDSGVPNLFTVFDLDREKSRAQKWGWQEQTQSLFGSIEVGWRSMLYLTVTGRNDWASQLAGSPQKSFFYPSVGLSWIPSATFDLPDAFTYLKLRASFSSVGIPFPRFLTTPTYAYDETTQQWLPTTFREIGQLYPERTKTWEVGLDTRLWDDVRLSASWYLADTSNQTFQPTVSTSSGYSSMYVQTGCVRNTGVEASLGYGHTWSEFSWDTNVTFTWNRNEILDLMDGMCDPMTGEPLKDRLEIKGLGKAKYILKKGGTMGDLYTTSNLKYDENGYIQVDRNGNFVTTDVGEEIYLGSVLPDYNLAWRNDFSWKGAYLGVLFTGRIGGICYSATQANLDLFGVSETSAAARDAGGVLINGREMVDPQRWYAAIASQSGLPHYYTYSATNFRLQELSVGYTLPRRWFRDVCSIDISFVGRNLWMIYCKAPFDPEAIASTGNNYQGIDYFMVPSLRSLGFSLRVTF
ncbi:SusC/RagA family protein [Alistipes sp. An116]|uniref:TonB-dependent receptor n=1 Tax=Alistipes sp. An116 TaxID=1965546 RepID=UPI000B39A8FD|nr:SusC/RagA family protein [Alistipes sp. An116]